MTEKRWLDVGSMVGLAVSLVAVCDMLQRWNQDALYSLYMVWGLTAAAVVGLVLLSGKAREHFQDACRGGSPFLWLRLAISVVFFILGWYINAASTHLYGAASAMVAKNGIRMFAVIFTMVAHVFYFGFTKKK